MTKKPAMLLCLDDHRGQYIPRDFANYFVDLVDSVQGVELEDWNVLQAGPDHEFYWEVWHDVLDYAVVMLNNVKYQLHQDGALWLVPVGMQWNDKTNTFEWSEQ